MRGGWEWRNDGAEFHKALNLLEVAGIFVHGTLIIAGDAGASA